MRWFTNESIPFPHLLSQSFPLLNNLNQPEEAQNPVSRVKTTLRSIISTNKARIGEKSKAPSGGMNDLKILR
jgi:hypothetical protein